MNESLDQPLETESVRKRPVMLLVLSILTYAGAVLMIITAAAQLKISTQMLDYQRNPLLPVYDWYTNLHKWNIFNSYLTFGNCLLTVIGAILMFRLKKSGFYTYIIGQLLLISGLIGTFYFSREIHYSPLTVGVISIPAIIALLFTVLYATNLKHMRK